MVSWWSGSLAGDGELHSNDGKKLLTPSSNRNILQMSIKEMDLGCFILCSEKS